MPPPASRPLPDAAAEMAGAEGSLLTAHHSMCGVPGLPRGVTISAPAPGLLLGHGKDPLPSA